MFRRSKNAFSLIELAIAFVIMGVFAFFGLQILQRSVQSKADAVAGQQLAAAANGLAQYVAANFNTLLAQLQSAGAPINIPLSTLTTGQYLDPLFPPTNNFGQTYAIYARQPSSTELELMVCAVGGPALSERAASDIVDYAAPYGGWTSVLHPGFLTGLGYSESLSLYSPLTAPTTGHVCARIYNSGNLSATNYLSRLPTGNPLANTMETSILMNNNSVSGANMVDTNDVQLNSVKINGSPALASRGVYATYFVFPGEAVPIPTCPAGTTPAIQPGASTFSDNGIGAAISAVQTTVSTAGSNWIVNMQVETQNGWVTPNANFGRLIVTVNCE